MGIELQLADLPDCELRIEHFVCWAHALVRHHPQFESELSRDVCVRICDEAESADLNAKYRSKAASTNVLSFAMSAPELDDIDLYELPLGDIVMCWPVLVGEAQAQGKAVRDHAAHLFVHGLLHLLGFDHVDTAQAKEMEALEIGVLAGLGIADPYAAQ